MLDLGAGDGARCRPVAGQSLPMDGIGHIGRFRSGAGSCAGWGRSAGTSFASTAILTADRADLIARYFIQGGYNSNYAAGWHLARGGLKFSVNAILQTFAPSGGAKGLAGTVGPLSAQAMDKSRVPSSNVAFIGCASAGDINEAVTATAFGKVQAQRLLVAIRKRSNSCHKVHCSPKS